MVEYAWSILAFPLLGALLVGLLGRWLGRKGTSLVACGAIGLAFLAACGTTLELLRFPASERALVRTLFTWIASGDFQVNVALLLDPLSLLISMVVSGVGFLIHIYSVGYMAEDPGYRRYFAYLNLFVFSMLLLVLADNFLVLYVGWELVGLCSYLLIGFWFERPAAAEAGKKAFIVTRIGDFGFALGILLIFLTFGTLDYGKVFLSAPSTLSGATLNLWGVSVATSTLITLLLFAGAIGKSAQIPLYVWLPDAMEGPTPVSALIHAATMVTAGVYMVARTHTLFLLAPFSSLVVASVGAITAFYAATIATTQNDIKRVLAYSTISQLGYMFLAVGVGAYAAGVFHLTTHAFFKALLFLGAGSVMHALAGELNMQKMGGLYAYLRTTALTFIIGWLAISGIPPFSGFFSKDQILHATYASGHTFLWTLGIATAVLTSFYMSRQVFLVFFGHSKMEHIHESPPVMTGPLVALATLAALAGLAGPRINGFLAPVFEGGGREIVASGMDETRLLAISVGAGLLGILLAWLTYIRGSIDPREAARRLGPLYTLLLNKYYVDEIYDCLAVKPLAKLAAFLAQVFDMMVIDGLVNGVAAFLLRAGQLLRRLQTGYVRNYALFFLLGVVSILAYLITR